MLSMPFYSPFLITVTEIYANDFNKVNILVSPEDCLYQFHIVVSNTFYLKQNLLDKKNQNLHKTRDLFLPKLISGEIDVSDLDNRIKNEFQES
jgi:type I restriction enzyme S subunit